MFNSHITFYEKMNDHLKNQNFKVNFCYFTEIQFSLSTSSLLIVLSLILSKQKKNSYKLASEKTSK